MTAIPGNAGLGPENYVNNAADAASQAYRRVMARQLAVMLLAGVLAGACVLGDYAAAVIVLQHVPVWIAVIIASVVIAELAGKGRLIRDYAEDHRSAWRRHRDMTRGEKNTAFLDGIRKTRARLARPSRTAEPRAGASWQQASTRLLYAACAVIVLTALAGTRDGILAAAAFSVLGMLAARWTAKTMPVTVAVLAFPDPRQPRNIPEA